VLEVLGRSDDRHTTDDSLLQELRRDAERERRLARARGRDREEVTRRTGAIELERLGLPGA
jgi:hypothetical protein